MGKASREKRERREGLGKLEEMMPPALKDGLLQRLGAAHDKGEALAVDAMEKAARIQLWGRKIWSPKVIKGLIPEGEEPIASRYDPHADTVHIATASGKRFIVGREKLTQRECELMQPAELVGGREVAVGGAPYPSLAEMMRRQGPPPMLPQDAGDLARALGKLPRYPDNDGGGEPAPNDRPSQIVQQMRELEAAWDDYQAAKLQEYMKAQLEAAKQAREQRECRCAPEGEGDPDAPPCPVHPEGGGRDGEGEGEGQDEQGEGDRCQEQQQDAPPPAPSFIEQWEMAEARCAEAKLARKYGDYCATAGCKAESEVMLKGDGHPFGVQAGPRCGSCARRILKANGMLLLDWSPDE